VFYLLSAHDTDQQEPFDNAPVLGAGEESIFSLLSSYRPLKAQGEFLISLHASYRSKGGVLYIYISPIAGGPTPIYIPLSEAQGRWPPYMVGRRML